MGEPVKVRVLCCEDVDDEDVFDAQFERHALQQRGARAGRRLVRHGPTRPTIGAAWMAIETAARRGEMPDVVLIDNYLKGPERTLVESGFTLLRRIVAELGDDRPLCILYTTVFDPGIAHAFCEQGGVHAISKLVGWDERIEIIWGAVDGDRWRHRPDPPLVDFTARDLALLPYLEADLSANETARALGLTDQQVHDSRRALYGRLQRAELVRFPLASQTKALADAALAAGAIWTPLRYRPD